MERKPHKYAHYKHSGPGIFVSITRVRLWHGFGAARHAAIQKLIHNTILDSTHADMRLRNTCIMLRSGSQSVNERAMAHKRAQVKPKEFRIQSMQRGDQQNGITFVALFVWTEKKKTRREDKNYITAPGPRACMCRLPIHLPLPYHWPFILIFISRQK